MVLIVRLKLGLNEKAGGGIEIVSHPDDVRGALERNGVGDEFARGEVKVEETVNDDGASFHVVIVVPDLDCVSDFGDGRLDAAGGAKVEIDDGEIGRACETADEVGVIGVGVATANDDEVVGKERGKSGGESFGEGVFGHGGVY